MVKIQECMLQLANETTSIIHQMKKRAARMQRV